MKNGFLFPGQGSQSIGMGKELYNELSEAKQILDLACDILGYDLKRIMFEGSDDDLKDTRYAQPAIYTCSAMYLEKAKQSGIPPAYVAGHSLGEYSALYCAGVFDYSVGLKLVRSRAEVMAAQNGKGGMAAVLGMPVDELQKYVEECNDIVIANLNTKTQSVVSGTKEGIAELAKRIESIDDVVIKELKVSAAFHSPQMKEASNRIAELIDKIDFNVPDVYVVSNVCAKPTMDTTEIKDNLKKQMTGQVHWFESVLAMKESGVDAFYEIGNGGILRKMNKAITLKPKCLEI